MKVGTHCVTGVKIQVVPESGLRVSLGSGFRLGSGLNLKLGYRLDL